MEDLSSEKVLLDLSNVKFIDSSGLGALIGINRRLINNRQSLALIGASERIKPTLELVQLQKIIPIFDSLEIAATANWVCED